MMAVNPDIAIAVLIIVLAATAPAIPSNIIIKPAKYIPASPKFLLSLYRFLSNFNDFTIILKNSRPVLALGTPSGTRILTCVAQTILNYIEFKKPLFEAVSSTRFHHQWFPNEIRIGSSPFPESTQKQLINMGHKIRLKPLGCKVQAIGLEKNILHGVSDPRGEGLSLGG